MAIFLTILAVFLLIGAVIFGVMRNNRSAGKPSAGTNSDGSPRKSSR